MRIQDLDQITDETIDLSQHLAIDDPSQSFKMTLLQLRDFFTGQLYPVGSTMFRLDNRTPNDCGFPGTWSKIATDLSLHTASADGSNVGVVDGVNHPLIPVPLHAHTASQVAHAHGASQVAHAHGAWQDAHDHTVYQDPHSHSVPSASGATREHCSDGCQEGSLVTMADNWTSTVQPAVYLDPSNSNIYMDSQAPAITVDIQTPAVTVDLAGEGSATLDVRGARIHGHLWHRVA